MRTRFGTAVRFSCAVVLLVAAGSGTADHGGGPTSFTFTTQSITPYAIEGLAGDNDSSLYTTGRAPAPTRCPVWQINGDAAAPVTPVQVGSIPNDATSPCNPSGIALDRFGNIYVADAALGGVIWRLTGADPNPTTAFATGVPGTNGLAFDGDGNLWTGDGTTGQGRVWRIGVSGGTCEPAHAGCAEVFRIPPMADAHGVGRQVATLQPPAAAYPQPLVANGVAFDGKRLCIANSDGDRRDNSPRAAGEINAGGPVGARGKIACADWRLDIPGLPLPVHYHRCRDGDGCSGMRRTSPRGGR